MSALGGLYRPRISFSGKQDLAGVCCKSDLLLTIPREEPVTLVRVLYVQPDKVPVSSQAYG